MVLNTIMQTMCRIQFLRAARFRSYSSSTQKHTQFGFIGLGQMGYNMARNLQSKLQTSDILLVQDINANATNRFLQETDAQPGGATVKIVSSVREASENSETVITVLPEPSHVKTVFRQILMSPMSPKSLSQERLFIDCSTIDPSSSRQVASTVQAANQGRFIDAPMSGGVIGARAGTLTFMLGAPEFYVSRIKAILLMMGKQVLHCGEQGAGLSGKLANNYLLAINNIATAEAMNLGVRSGLDPKVLANLINVSTGRCWPSEVNNPVRGVVDGSPASRDYQGGFGISLMKKDLTLAINAAREAGAKLELGNRACEVYEMAEQDEKCIGKDFSVIYKYLGGS